MREGAFLFAGQWKGLVQKLPETGQDYTVVSLGLSDGRQFGQAIISAGYLSRIHGLANIPFSESEIVRITPTHQKWDWAERP
jgi:hypothetical protein